MFERKSLLRIGYPYLLVLSLVLIIGILVKASDYYNWIIWGGYSMVFAYLGIAYEKGWISYSQNANELGKKLWNKAYLVCSLLLLLVLLEKIMDFFIEDMSSDNFLSVFQFLILIIFEFASYVAPSASSRALLVWQDIPMLSTLIYIEFISKDYPAYVSNLGLLVLMIFAVIEHFIWPAWCGTKR